MLDLGRPTGLIALKATIGLATSIRVTLWDARRMLARTQLAKRHAWNMLNGYRYALPELPSL